MKMALNIGITGQDYTSLAGSDLERGNDVYGIKRRNSLLNIDYVDHFYQDPYTRGQRHDLHYSEVSNPRSQICTRRGSYDLGSRHNSIFTHHCQTVVPFYEGGDKFA